MIDYERVAFRDGQDRVERMDWKRELGSPVRYIVDICIYKRQKAS